jgi:hypothetical protein
MSRHNNDDLAYGYDSQGAGQEGERGFLSDLAGSFRRPHGQGQQQQQQQQQQQVRYGSGLQRWKLPLIALRSRMLPKRTSLSSTASNNSPDHRANRSMAVRPRPRISPLQASSPRAVDPSFSTSYPPQSIRLAPMSRAGSAAQEKSIHIPTRAEFASMDPTTDTS